MNFKSYLNKSGQYVYILVKKYYGSKVKNILINEIWLLISF